MKKIILIILSFVVLACKNSSNQKEALLISNTGIIEEGKISKANKGFLVCDSTKIDFGKIKKNDVVIQKFKFYNTGEEEVKILHFDASCSCTSLEISKRNIPIKDSMIVTMKVETKDKSKGSHIINATLKTNGKRSFYALSTKFEVE